jgi:DNA-binding PadR family transcriptional regulator
MHIEFDRELKKGSTELPILALLEPRPRHGYDLATLIEGRWVEKPGERRRRFYGLTAQGRSVLARRGMPMLAWCDGRSLFFTRHTLQGNGFCWVAASAIEKFGV